VLEVKGLCGCQSIGGKSLLDDGVRKGIVLKFFRVALTAANQASTKTLESHCVLFRAVCPERKATRL
jgi:hypothetical protein